MLKPVIEVLLEMARRTLFWLYIQMDRFDHESINGHEHEHSIDYDIADENPEITDVNLHRINFGDLTIACPNCGEDSEAVLVGLGVREDQDEESETNSVSTIGVVVYPCNEAFYSPCLTDKVATILNDEETGNLRLELFVDLIKCAEHGSDHSSEEAE